MRVRRVLMPGSGAESWTVLGEDHVPVEPVERFLAFLAAIERSPNTVRAYAHDLKDWFAFLNRHGLDWRAATAEEVAGVLEDIFTAGDPTALRPERLDTMRVAALLERSAARCPWYAPEGGARSPWGRAGLPMEMVSVLSAKAGAAWTVRGPALGLFLDLEIRLVEGPVFGALMELLRRAGSLPVLLFILIGVLPAVPARPVRTANARLRRAKLLLS